MENLHYWMHYIAADLIMGIGVFYLGQYVFGLVVDKYYKFADLHGWNIVKEKALRCGYTDWQDAFNDIHEMSVEKSKLNVRKD